MTTSPHAADVRRRAGWLPENQDELESWLDGHRERATAKGEQVVLHPVLTEFQELIDTDPVVRMYISQMIAQVPNTKPYRKRHLESVPHMMRLINEVLTMAPEFGANMVATPLGAILDWTMGTPAGFAAFRDPRVNTMIKKILERLVLSSSAAATRSTCSTTRRPAGNAPRPGARSASSSTNTIRRTSTGALPRGTTSSPGASRTASVRWPRPEDDKVIVSACESTPYGISTDVKLQDRFWIKSQPYSLQDMLANDDSVGQFVGGTVYQAFLSATNYHRWHSPVAGTIVRAFVVPGTYYSEPDSEGADAVEPMNSQSYLAHVAARAVILIEADDPVIGLMAFVAVGMSEVSSCLIGSQITPGYHVAKGAELGYFQYGGSTHCLVFRPGAIADFALAGHSPATRPQGAADACPLEARHRRPGSPTRRVTMRWATGLASAPVRCHARTRGTPCGNGLASCLAAFLAAFCLAGRPPGYRGDRGVGLVQRLRCPGGLIAALGGQRQAMDERPGQRQGDGQQQPRPQAPGEKCPHAQGPFFASPRCVPRRYPPCPGLTTSQGARLSRVAAWALRHEDVTGMTAGWRPPGSAESINRGRAFWPCEDAGATESVVR